ELVYQRPSSGATSAINLLPGADTDTPPQTCCRCGFGLSRGAALLYDVPRRKTRVRRRRNPRDSFAWPVPVRPTDPGGVVVSSEFSVLSAGATSRWYGGVVQDEPRRRKAGRLH